MFSVRLVLLATVVASVTAVACSDSRKPSPKAKAEARHGALRAKIIEIGRRADADTSWMSAISAQRGFFASLYSVDLEKLWLINRPILFAGTLADVATESNADYKLIVRHSDFLSPELRLDILCAKDLVAPVLSAVKSDRNVIDPGGIAVSARISRIRYMTEPEKEGTKSVFVGYGRCNDIEYLGDGFDLMFLLQDAPKE